MGSLFKQILRFGVVGGLAFFIDYSVLWVLVDLLSVNYLVASALSFSVSVVFNYVLSTLWVFEVTEAGNKAGNFIIFVVLSIVGLLLNLAIMWVGVDLFRINYLIVKIGSTGIVMVYNFITRKLILEGKSSNNLSE